MTAKNAFLLCTITTKGETVSTDGQNQSALCFLLKTKYTTINIEDTYR